MLYYLWSCNQQTLKWGAFLHAKVMMYLKKGNWFYVELLLRLKSTPCIVMLMIRQSDLSLEISLP